MLFNSFEFILIFLPITFLVFFFLSHFGGGEASRVWLLGASLFFYGWWEPVYVPLILGSIIFNFGISQTFLKLKSKNHVFPQSCLLIGILSNLALLGYFKYADFFIENLNWSLDTKIELPHIILPLAISFFTFQQIAYLVDSYKGEVKESSFINYSLFVLFFPQLISGPIVHHKEMMPQFHQPTNKRFNINNVFSGSLVFFIGLFKKVVVADTFAIWASQGFDATETIALVEAWIASLSFTLQLYFDFSGYTDMAVGIALLFNIKLPNNFNSPFQAASIINFWARWHITLTRFITTYLYTPIIRGFRSISFKNSMIATFLAMLIAGLWHGAAWTFVVFGAIHGGALVVNHVWKRLKLPCSKFMGWFLTFNLVNLSFIIFRANELKDAVKVIRGMLGFSGVVVTADLIEALPFVKNFGFYVGDHLLNIEASDDVFRMLFLAGIMILFGKNSTHISNAASMSWTTIIVASFVIVLSIFSLGKESPFLYFNF